MSAPRYGERQYCNAQHLDGHPLARFGLWVCSLAAGHHGPHKAYENYYDDPSLGKFYKEWEDS